MYRSQVHPDNRPVISSSRAAYELLRNSWDMNKIELLEEFVILLLDRSNHCLGISRISQGGISSCIVDPKIVFTTGLKARATGIILAHNHPSGVLDPSTHDISMTNKLSNGASLLDMSIQDHIILSPYSYYSFRDEGLIPW
jgi:DNA repair protein RadC